MVCDEHKKPGKMLRFLKQGILAICKGKPEFEKGGGGRTQRDRQTGVFLSHCTTFVEIINIQVAGERGCRLKRGDCIETGEFQRSGFYSYCYCYSYMCGACLMEVSVSVASGVGDRIKLCVFPPHFAKTSLMLLFFSGPRLGLIFR